MSGTRLRTVVADTTGLVSFGLPRADADYDTGTAPDPLQSLLTSCEVSVPPAVVSELQNPTPYRDIHRAAATTVLAARDHYTVDDPYEGGETPDSRPAVGLDDGETDGILLANALAVDGFLTDEFGGTNFALVYAALQGPRIGPRHRDCSVITLALATWPSRRPVGSSRRSVHIAVARTARILCSCWRPSSDPPSAW